MRNEVRREGERVKGVKLEDGRGMKSKPGNKGEERKTQAKR